MCLEQSCFLGSNHNYIYLKLLLILNPLKYSNEYIWIYSTNFYYLNFYFPRDSICSMELYSKRKSKQKMQHQKWCMWKATNWMWIILVLGLPHVWSWNQGVVVGFCDSTSLIPLSGWLLRGCFYFSLYSNSAALWVFLKITVFLWWKARLPFKILR